MSLSEIRLKIVEDAYVSFRNQDLEGFLKPFDETSLLVEADSLPYGGIYKGTDAIREAMLTINATWADISFEIAEIVAGKNLVIAYGELFMTARTTLKKINFPLVEVWEFEDVRLKSLKPVYCDTAAALRALQRHETVAE